MHTNVRLITFLRELRNQITFSPVLVPSVLDEITAMCISDMARQDSNGQYLVHTGGELHPTCSRSTFVTNNDLEAHFTG